MKENKQKRKDLLRRQESYKDLKKSNNMLELIKKDYNKYNNFIVKQKHDQVKALEILNEYINDLKETNSLSENNVKDAYQERTKISKEILKIRNNIDQIIKYVD